MGKLYNLARMTTATTGTGNITLGAAVSGYLTFAQAGVSNGETVSYAIKDGANSEIGTAPYNSTGTVLGTRSVTKSTNSNAAISLSGSAEVFITPRAEDLPILRGYLDGLTLSTAGSSASFSVAAGMVVDSNNAEYLSLSAAISKTTSAWAVGTGNGGLDTGAIAANTWYHAHLIKRIDTNVVDAVVSLSPTSPTLPTNYTLAHYLGPMLTDGASKWTAFTQLGDEWLWKTHVGDVSAGALSTTGALVTLTVPTGIQVQALFTVDAIEGSGATFALISSPDQNNDTPSASAFSFIINSAYQQASQFSVRTNTSGQVRQRIDAGTATYYLVTRGWIYRRGRDI